MTESRQCSRPSCTRPALFTLRYIYAEQLATLSPLAHDKDPHSWDLCERHALRTTVPQGWRLEDRDDIDFAEHTRIDPIESAHPAKKISSRGESSVRIKTKAERRSRFHHLRPVD